MNETTTPITIPGSQTSYTLADKKQIVFERTYDAAPSEVFAAFCDPKLVPRWWGSVGSTLVVEEMDVRPGGKWRFVETDAKGKKSTFSGVYDVVDAPRRIEATFRYGAGVVAAIMPIVHETYEFIPHEGKTRLRLTSVYPMGAALKGMLSVGMDAPGKNIEGSRHQWRLDRLATLVGAK